MEELAKLKKKEDRRKARVKKKFGEKLISFLYEISMYTATATGVMFSKYLPAFKGIIQGEINEINFGTPYRLEIIASLALAFILVYLDEKNGNEEGKRRNWKKRVLNHIARGIMWHTVIGG